MKLKKLNNIYMLSQELKKNQKNYYDFYIEMINKYKTKDRQEA